MKKKFIDPRGRELERDVKGRLGPDVHVPDTALKGAEDLQVAQDLDKIVPPVFQKYLRRPKVTGPPPWMDMPPDEVAKGRQYPDTSGNEKLWRLPKTEVFTWSAARFKWNRYAARYQVKRLVDHFETARYFVFRYLP